MFPNDLVGEPGHDDDDEYRPYNNMFQVGLCASMNRTSPFLAALLCISVRVECAASSMTMMCLVFSR
jgi:hypothetical protein